MRRKSSTLKLTYSEVILPFLQLAFYHPLTCVASFTAGKVHHYLGLERAVLLGAVHRHPDEAGHVQLGVVDIRLLAVTAANAAAVPVLLLLGDVLAGDDLGLERVLLVKVHPLAAPLEPGGQVPAQLQGGGLFSDIVGFHSNNSHA